MAQAQQEIDAPHSQPENGKINIQTEREVSSAKSQERERNPSPGIMNSSPGMRNEAVQWEDVPAGDGPSVRTSQRDWCTMELESELASIFPRVSGESSGQNLLQRSSEVGNSDPMAVSTGGGRRGGLSSSEVNGSRQE